MTAADLFAGAGGTSEGARIAGIRVVWAGNHWRPAVDTHAVNHPEAEHACQDLHQADWRLVPKHDIGLASPACTGHAWARGTDRPHHDTSRSTAWAVVSCAEYHRQPVWMIENVPEFRLWALFPAWSAAMQALGYSLALHEIDAADCGVPQHRVRLIIVATRSRAPLRLKIEPQPHVPVSRVLDLAAGKWSPVAKPRRAAATLARVDRGRREVGQRFVMPYYGRGSGLTGRSLDRPLGTVTTLDRWAVVDGDRMRMLTVPEYRAVMGFRSDYALPPQRRPAIQMLGNAVPPPLAAAVLSEIRRAA